MLNHRKIILVILVAGKMALSAQPSGSITLGQGQTSMANLMPNCAGNHITPLGTITSTDNKIWDVPAPNNFLNGPYLTDLHNQCNSVTPANLAAVNLNNVPVTVIDAGGDTVTAFLFCDNYFELYINGILIGVDAVPFTPFNSSIAKFKVSRPYTIAVKLVDWEENLGLGSEIQPTDSFHAGDGGFIAQFSDGTVTGSDWKTQSFYIAPLQNTSDVIELPNGIHSTASASATPTCKANCYGVHYEIPTDWNATSFNDSAWPNAFIYTANQVTNQPAYTNFASTAWGNANFIWSSNLILDNLVLTRKTVGIANAINEPAGSDLVGLNTLFSNSIDFRATTELKEIEIKLIDISGKTVQFWNLSDFKEGSSVGLPISANISNGVYLLYIKTQTFSITKKIIHIKP